MFAVLSAARFKRADYLLPPIPFAAIAVGCAAEAWLAIAHEPAHGPDREVAVRRERSRRSWSGGW